MSDEQRDRELYERLRHHDARLSVVETKVDLMGQRMSSMAEHSEIQTRAMQELAVCTGRLEQRFSSGQFWIGILLAVLTLAVSGLAAAIGIYTGILGG